MSTKEVENGVQEQPELEENSSDDAAEVPQSDESDKEAEESEESRLLGDAPPTFPDDEVVDLTDCDNEEGPVIDVDDEEPPNATKSSAPAEGTSAGAIDIDDGETPPNDSSIVEVEDEIPIDIDEAKTPTDVNVPQPKRLPEELEEGEVTTPKKRKYDVDQATGANLDKKLDKIDGSLFESAEKKQ